MNNKQDTKHPRELILIADDDYIQRLLMKETLEHAGLKVIEAENGKQALDVFNDNIPSLVILDVKMPEMDGFEACSKIREITDNREIPIVMVTGLDDIESIKKSYQHGATDFITKPVLWPVFSERILYLLKASRTFSSLKSSQMRLAKAQEIANIGSYEWDLLDSSLYWSDEIYRILGIPVNSIKPSHKSYLQFTPRNDRTLLKTVIQHSIDNRKPFKLEHDIIQKDGRKISVEQQGEIVCNDSGIPIRIHGTIQDITERKNAEDEIQRLAYYDTLTDLPNRQLFAKHATLAFSNAVRNNKRTAVLFLDLDRFKDINDSLGHSAGDELLRIVATYLQNSVRSSDLISKFNNPKMESATLSRLGGDEFTILLPDLQDIDVAARVASRVLEHLSMPIKLRGQEFFITGSLGIAVCPDDGTDTDTLLKNADIAMYYAKRGGRNNYRFYAEHMNERLKEKLALEANLKKALANNEFQLYYQPKTDIHTGELKGLEALIRWQHPEQGMISPETFIPVAEETGLINAIGEWVLYTACDKAAELIAAGIPPFEMGVNLSSHQFRQKNLVQSVIYALKQSNLDPHCLELELTESAIMDNVEETINILYQLKETGVKLSVDDFGTGYSSMSYLKKFPLDTLKIDKSFTDDLITDSNDATIIKAIIGLAKGLGLKSIAEGVETQAQLTFLQDNDCDQIQGYLISKPVPTDDIETFLKNYNPEEQD